MWPTHMRVRISSVAPSFLVRTIMEFKSSDSAKPSKPVAPARYDTQIRGTIAPTVVDPVDIVRRERAQKAGLRPHATDVGDASPKLENELNSLGIPDDMQEFMKIALRKPHLITITYVSNTGRFQHFINAHNRFPKEEVVKIFDHLKVEAKKSFLGKPDLAGGLKNQIARQKKPQLSGGRSKRRKGKNRRR